MVEPLCPDSVQTHLYAAVELGWLTHVLSLWPGRFEQVPTSLGRVGLVL